MKCTQVGPNPSSVSLFPEGKLQLQIFEVRYLDIIKRYAEREQVKHALLLLLYFTTGFVRFSAPLIQPIG